MKQMDELLNTWINRCITYDYIKVICNKFSLACLTLLFLIVSFNTYADSMGRPSTNGQPTKVSARVNVLNIDNIDTPGQRFTANVFFVLKWLDPRLAHAASTSRVIPLIKVWHPRIGIVNRQRMWKTLPDVVEVTPKGEVTYRQRVWGFFAQPLNLYQFPLDKQPLSIQFASVGYTPEQVTIIPTKDSGIAQYFSQPDWKVLSWDVSPTPYKVTDDSIPAAGLKFTIHVKRHVIYYVFKFVVPLLLIVCMSFMVFWIPSSETSTRISVAVTSMLTLIAYRFVVATALPKVSYLTRLDIFILASTLLVFLNLIITAVSSYFKTNEQFKLANKFDLVCRWASPTILLIILAFSFII